MRTDSGQPPGPCCFRCCWDLQKPTTSCSSFLRRCTAHQNDPQEPARTISRADGRSLAGFKVQRPPAVAYAAQLAAKCATSVAQDKHPVPGVCLWYIQEMGEGETLHGFSAVVTALAGSGGSHHV